MGCASRRALRITALSLTAHIGEHSATACRSRYRTRASRITRGMAGISSSITRETTYRAASASLAARHETTASRHGSAFAREKSVSGHMWQALSSAWHLGKKIAARRHACRAAARIAQQRHAPRAAAKTIVPAGIAKTRDIMKAWRGRKHQQHQHQCITSTFAYGDNSVLAFGESDAVTGVTAKRARTTQMKYIRHRHSCESTNGRTYCGITRPPRRACAWRVRHLIIFA